MGLFNFSKNKKTEDIKLVYQAKQITLAGTLTLSIPTDWTSTQQGEAFIFHNNDESLRVVLQILQIQQGGNLEAELQSFADAVLKRLDDAGMEADPEVVNQPMSISRNYYPGGKADKSLQQLHTFIAVTPDILTHFTMSTTKGLGDGTDLLFTSLPTTLKRV